jgi:hypothetical protein
MGAAVTTAFWLLVLVSSCHIFNIDAGARLILGVGLPIAIFSLVTLCIVTADR